MQMNVQTLPTDVIRRHLEAAQCMHEVDSPRAPSRLSCVSEQYTNQQSAFVGVSCTDKRLLP